MRCAAALRLSEKNFFDLMPADIYTRLQTHRKGLIVINPPYGRRLGKKADAGKLFFELCRKLKTDFKGWKAALIAPDKNLIRKVPFKTTTQHLFHGGLNLSLLIGTVA